MGGTLKNDRKNLIVILIVSLILSVSISVAIVTGYIEFRERSAELLVDIDTDRPPVGVEPLTLNFSANILNAKGDITCLWNFGNGEKAEGKKVSVTYDEPGIYDCVLTVTDETGRKAADTIQVVVNKNNPPVVSLSINIQTVDRPFKWLNLLALIPVPFNPFGWAGNQQKILNRIEEKEGPWAWGESEIVITAQVMDPEGDEIVSYEWREQTQDKVVTITGETFLPAHNLTGNETVKIPALYAWMLGRHIVTLTVKDSAGNVATAKIDYIVSEGPLETRLKLLKQMMTLVLGGKAMEKIMGAIWEYLKNIVTG